MAMTAEILLDHSMAGADVDSYARRSDVYLADR